MGDAYLIWSHEHYAWWGPQGDGYTRELEEAGRYQRERALLICANAIPGTMQRLGTFPEIPVREADVLEVLSVPLI